jgi:hypothetical protein
MYITFMEVQAVIKKEEALGQWDGVPGKIQASE